MSSPHCNFLVNRSAATTARIEALGEGFRRRLREARAVEMEWKNRRVGEVG